jgi:hypothetical protein
MAGLVAVPVAIYAWPAVEATAMLLATEPWFQFMVPFLIPTEVWPTAPSLFGTPAESWGTLVSSFITLWQTLSCSSVQSVDPNTKMGPGGFGTNGFITASGTLAYRVDFENETNASAPAQQVVITDQLGGNLDWSTFRLAEVGFGDQLIVVPPNSQHFETNVAVSYLGTNFQVQIEAGIQLYSGLVYANFRSVDPATSLPPPVNIGFLPPEDGTGRGRGHIAYTISARPNLPTGAQIRNVAQISFDLLPSLATDLIDPHNPASGHDPAKQCLNTIYIGPPMIFAQPQSQTNNAGTTVTFSLSAWGTEPLYYQWRFNGGAIAGATDASLTLRGVTMNQAGDYSVVVSNSFGAVTSSNAVLAVVPASPLASLIAWGDNTFGQTNVPAGLNNVIGIACGEYHNLALTEDGEVAAWGGNFYGETNVPVDLTNVVAIAGGGTHSLALKGDGRVVAWGSNQGGQTNVPPELSEAVQISAGVMDGLALKHDGTVVAWGSYWDGQSYVPMWVRAGLSNVVALAAGGHHALALQADGMVVAWGNNQYNQTVVPTSATNVVAIAAGGYHSLALQAGGTVVGWGRNEDGQATVPPGLTRVAAIAAGGWHSLALKADGTVVAWGMGSTNIPAGLTNVTAIAGGWAHSLALIGDGRPIFTVQPWSQTVRAGAPVTLSALAVGAQPLTYRWHFNGNLLEDGGRISGARSSTLTIASVELADVGVYVLTVFGPGFARDSDPATLTVVPPLQITDFQPTASGFAARFNRALDVSALNLYDDEAQTLGPPDVVVTNAAGPVTGSLICDSAAQTATFIKTGGPLPPGNYSVTLRSATNGFKDTDGHPLDGDGDGVEGGDFVTTVTVLATTNRVLTLPDFARGPGQPVNIPATNSGIPVVLSDGAGVVAVQFEVDYDPTLIQMQRVSLDDAMPSGWSAAGDTPQPGTLSVRLFGITSLPPGSVTVVRIEAVVPETATYRRAEVLHLRNVLLNNWPIIAESDSAVHVVAYFGDTSGDRCYSSFDAALAAQLSVGLGSGFLAYPCLDPVLVGDVAGEGVVGSISASMIARRATGVDIPEIPALPRPHLNISKSGYEVTLSWPAWGDPYHLETTDMLGPSAAWHPATNVPQAAGNFLVVTTEPTNTTQFYRLRRQ